MVIFGGVMRKANVFWVFLNRRTLQGARMVCIKFNGVISISYSVIASSGWVFDAFGLNIDIHSGVLYLFYFAASFDFRTSGRVL